LWNRKPPAKRERSSDASSDEGGTGEHHDYFPATRLFEYRWPPEQEKAELYFLQEQVAEFLQIRGIQRKYPDLLRRNVDVPEKKYLMARGVVTEMQSNMGLVAVRSEDVLEVMSEDFPEKYQEYMVVAQEREFQNTLQLRILETRKIALMREQGGGGEEVRSVRSEAVNEVVEFNKKLALQRRLQHCSYHDRQTQITHIPRKAMRVQSPPKLSRYPVALLPGQYSDFCHRYSPEDLLYMPLNTALALPEKPAVPPPSSQPPVTSADTTTNHPLTCAVTTIPHVSHIHRGCDATSDDDGHSLTQSVDSSGGSGVPAHEHIPVTTRTKPSRSGMVCSVCYRGRASNRQEQPEQLLQCSHCLGNIHPSCLGMSSEAASVAVTYPWQCLECKTCSVCKDPGGEEEMVFCDHCDRGYHTFCLSMQGIPEGQWLCMQCCKCSSCGSERGRGNTAQWRHEVTAHF
jgi:hypothetical protein